MAGFFGLFDYTKPGRGVKKDEPEKKRGVVYFERYFRYFGKLVNMNLLYFICCLPFFLPLIFLLLSKSFNLGGIRGFAIFFICWVPLMFTAPVTSGFIFVMRNLARGEHAFLWMDFRDNIKSNWKQSLVVGALNTVISFVLYVTIHFYGGMMKTNGIFIVPFAVCLFLFIVFIFAQYYIFTIIVTFKLDLKNIIKDSIIFSFAGAGWNILITAISTMILTFVFLLSPFALILLPVIALSTIGYTICFFTWPTIERYMIPADSGNDGGNNDDSGNDQIFDDTRDGNDDNDR